MELNDAHVAVGAPCNFLVVRSNIEYPFVLELLHVHKRLSGRKLHGITNPAPTNFRWHLRF